MSIQLSDQERNALAPFIVGYEIVHGKIQGSIFESNIAGKLFDDIVEMNEVYKKINDRRSARFCQEAIDILMKYI